MSQEATLHIKIEKSIADKLKHIAARRKKSRGQLVREAIHACYQVDLANLSKHQEQALAAYQGGFISIGKLAEVMGMHVLDMRTWLNDHTIAQNSQFAHKDITNA